MTPPKFIISVMLITIAFASCKKDESIACDSSLPAKETINYSGEKDGYRFVLLPDGRMDSIVRDYGIYKFTYDGNTITCFQTDLNNKPFNKTVITRNNQGAVIKRAYIGYKASGGEDPGSAQTTTYEYDGIQLVKDITTYAPLYPDAKIKTYQWKNGNMVASTEKKGTSTRTSFYWYDEDKPYQSGDGFFMYNYTIFGNAAFTIKNKNLLKGSDASSTEPVINTLYTFDNKGRIVSSTVPGGSGTSTHEFEYSCN